MAKYVYPAIFYPAEDGGYTVDFPDLTCTTQGDDVPESFEMAEDALALTLYTMESDGDEIPKSTPINEVHPDDPDAFVSYVTADTMEYRKIFNNKSVKKTLSIPEWLNEAALEHNINFSNVLQNALLKELNL